MIQLVVLEDDVHFREAIVDKLNQTEEFQCIASFDRIETFLDALPNYFPHVFWLDIRLPDGMSIDYIPKIKEIYPNSLCLICTFYDDDENIFSAIKAGADGYLLKTDSFQKMQEGIRELVAGGSPMSPFIARKVINSLKTSNNQTSIAELTNREQEILSKLAQGHPYKEVASLLAISLETVKKHVQNMYKKLHVQNRSEAILKYLDAKKDDFLGCTKI